jgi:hypothetical protein
MFYCIIVKVVIRLIYFPIYIDTCQRVKLGFESRIGIKIESRIRICIKTMPIQCIHDTA